MWCLVDMVMIVPLKTFGKKYSFFNMSDIHASKSTSFKASSTVGKHANMQKYVVQQNYMQYMLQ